MLRLALVVIAVLLAAGSTKPAAQPAPRNAAPAPPPAIRKELVLIPFPGTSVQMRTRIVRPPGQGPFPLAIISHGTAADAETRSQHVVPQYRAIVDLLAGRGYVVAIPQRPGHGKTGGPYFEGAGECDNADFASSGHAAAKSIRVVIDYMMQQPYVRKARVVLVGHSAGGWGSLALASRFPDLVESVINFAGGHGGRFYDVPNQNCSPDRLVEAAGDFGRTTRVPTLWIYFSNDTYFGPTLAARMAEAFRAAGGSVDLRILPLVGEDGHFAIEMAAAVPIWRPVVDGFLRKNQTKTRPGHRSEMAVQRLGTDSDHFALPAGQARLPPTGTFSQRQ